MDKPEIDEAVRDDDLPTVTHSAEREFLGYKLTMHTLSDGRRVIEDTPELRRMLGEMGFELRDPVALKGAKEKTDAPWYEFYMPPPEGARP